MTFVSTPVRQSFSASNRYTYIFSNNYKPVSEPNGSFANEESRFLIIESHSKIIFPFSRMSQCIEPHTKRRELLQFAWKTRTRIHFRSTRIQRI